MRGMLPCAMGAVVSLACAGKASGQTYVNVVVRSSTNVSGVPIKLWPPDQTGKTSGNTPFVVGYPIGSTVHLTAPSSHNGVPFCKWLWDTSCSTTVFHYVGPTTQRVYAMYFFPGAGALTSFGNGCAGTAPQPVTQTASGATRVGQMVSYDLTAGAPPSAQVAFALGLSKAQFGPFALPFEGSPVGAPGCFLYCDHTLVLYTQTDSSGQAKVPVRYPNDASLKGMNVYTQFLVQDLGANSLGLTSSNAYDTLLGGCKQGPNC